MDDESERIGLAFRNIEYSLRMLDYIERGELDRPSFDRDLAFGKETGYVHCHSGAFRTDGTLKAAAHNAYLGAIGVSVIVLDTACNKAGLPVNAEATKNSGKVRNVIYQLRCSYAHDMLHPVWSAHHRYCRLYRWELFGRNRRLDLRALTGKPCRLSDIGGLSAYFDIRNEVLRWLAGEKPQEHGWWWT